VPNDVAIGRERTLGRVEELFDKMLATRDPGAPDVWGVGIGLPAPVEFSAGRPVSPPIMPGWDCYPVGQRLSRHYRAPVWMDNDVNLMALGELRAGLARDQTDVVYIKIRSGSGAGLISAGHLHCPVPPRKKQSHPRTLACVRALIHAVAAAREPISYRSTSSSAFVDAGERPSRTSQPHEDQVEQAKRHG